MFAVQAMEGRNGKGKRTWSNRVREGDDSEF